MKKLGMGLVGPGFVAAHHIDAVRRLGDVEVVAIAGSSRQSAERRAREWKVDRAYGSFEELIRDPDIDVVHNTTPNHLHFPVNMMAIAAGKHIISDKPLAMNPEEALQLRDAAHKASVAHVVIFNYRGNPLIQQARFMAQHGEIGATHFIHGFYLQDWMADDSVYSWRSDPALGGASSALGDIGSHWCDLAQHVSGANIEAVLADLTTVIPVRYSAGASRQAFALSDEKKGEAVRVSGEDLASVLLRFDNGAKGCFSVGQVIPGHKNELRLEVSGRSASLKWEQEEPNELWVGRYGQPNSVITKDPAQLTESARRYARLPAGHQGGWADAFLNVVSDAYEWIRAQAAPEAKPATTATFDDGYRMSCVIDAMLKSHAGGSVWQKVEYTPAATLSTPK
jgi:predicted dehydrogenase